jgi:hypothetical protein
VPCELTGDRILLIPANDQGPQRELSAESRIARGSKSWEIRDSIKENRSFNADGPLLIALDERDIGAARQRLRREISWLPTSTNCFDDRG